MCKLVKNNDAFSIVEISKEELGCILSMINGSGLMERRVFNSLKNEVMKEL